MTKSASRSLVLAALAATALCGASTSALAQPYGSQSYAPQYYAPSDSRYSDRVFAPSMRDESTGTIARFQRQVVDYPTREAAGTIVIDTPNTYLYLVLGGGKAVRYGIGVGREGFTWSGVETISRVAEWPDWYPPAEMIARQPYLPRFMAGGPSNPLGARALYLGHSQYRIHGTNAPDTIGHHVSSGCIRLTNDNIVDLFSRVHVGTRVVVLPLSPRDRIVQASTQPAYAPQPVRVNAATTDGYGSSTAGSASSLY